MHPRHSSSKHDYSGKPLFLLSSIFVFRPLLLYNIVKLAFGFSRRALTLKFWYGQMVVTPSSMGAEPRLSLHAGFGFALVCLRRPVFDICNFFPQPTS